MPRSHLTQLAVSAAASAIVAMLAAGARPGTAQAPAPATSAFVATSIRPVDTSGKVHQYSFKIEPNRLTVQYFTVRTLLEEAYHLQDYQLRLSTTGKDKKDKQAIEQLYAAQPFDIQAVTGAPVTESAMRALLGKLLADRFHVVSHWDTEAIPMYRLEVLPGGIQLKKLDTGYPHPNSPFGGGRGTCVLEFQGPMSMPQLAGMAAQWITAPKPVVDHTGVDGFFAMELKFLQPGCVPTAGEAGADSPQNALKSIGLKLMPARDPIKVLVVESVGPVDEN